MVITIINNGCLRVFPIWMQLEMLSRITEEIEYE